MPTARSPAISHLPQASLLPLHALLDDVALIEGCDGAEPLPETGHRVADAGAALVLAVEMAHDRFAATIARHCVTFLDAMHLGDGRFRSNDVDADDVHGNDESCGWAIEGIGVATGAPWLDVREGARRGRCKPEPVAGADAIGDADDRAAALASLRWFAELETSPGHLSPTPTGGRGPDELGAGFDQRPISAAALAAAAGRALRLTGGRSWERPVVLAAGWFAGANDVGVMMFDRDTGRAFDALRHDGADRCQGAEAAGADRSGGR